MIAKVSCSPRHESIEIPLEPLNVERSRFFVDGCGLVFLTTEELETN